jgi:hypothetical protein
MQEIQSPLSTVFLFIKGHNSDKCGSREANRRLDLNTRMGTKNEDEYVFKIVRLPKSILYITGKLICTLFGV